MELCPVCGEEECDGPDNHDLIRQMQVSDYSLPDFYEQAVGMLRPIIGVLDGRDINGRFMADDWSEGLYANEILDEFEDRVPSTHAVWSDSDYWSIWRV